MDNQKDTQKTEINSYGQNANTKAISLNHKPLYEFANKKTEKLVTALYMVTDCMDTDDALKGKLRFLGVELLSDMYKLSTLSPVDKSNHIVRSLSHIKELISFVGIAATIGFISEMNSSILHREFRNLITELESYQSKETQFNFTLNESMFEVEKTHTSFMPNNHIKDKSISNGHLIKKTNLTSSYHSLNSQSALSKRPANNSVNIADKQERAQKILSFIKDKKNVVGIAGGMSIKDISVAFIDCSEKTIQRELNVLVAKGLIKKLGAKRWSRYQAL